MTALRELDVRVTRRVAAWDSVAARRMLPAVEEASRHTKLWCGAAVLMATAGGWRGRRAAAAGLGGMAVAQVVCNAVAKRLAERSRPPREWSAADGEADDRPGSSSFPSGHTAAAVAFTCAVAPTWPWVGAACAAPAVAVAVERVHSCAHYPSDVAAGAVLGLAAACLVRRSPRLLLRHWP
ncbi:hypothetical protein GCM10027168_62900 [Streptomyces capparidis]